MVGIKRISVCANGTERDECVSFWFHSDIVSSNQANMSNEHSPRH